MYTSQIKTQYRAVIISDFIAEFPWLSLIIRASVDTQDLLVHLPDRYLNNICHLRISQKLVELDQTRQSSKLEIRDFCRIKICKRWLDICCQTCLAAAQMFADPKKPLLHENQPLQFKQYNRSIVKKEYRNNLRETPLTFMVDAENIRYLRGLYEKSVSQKRYIRLLFIT